MDCDHHMSQFVEDLFMVKGKKVDTSPTLSTLSVYMKMKKMGSRANLNLLLNLLGVGVGLGLGFLLRHLHATPFTLFWVGFLGQLYIRFLTMMVIPLAVSSLIAGAASLGVHQGRMFGCVLLLLVLANNIIASVTGLGLIHLALSRDQLLINSSQVEEVDSYSAVSATLLRNIVPVNLFSATFQKLSHVSTSNHKTSVSNSSLPFAIPEVAVSTPNIMGIVFVALLFGFFAGLDREKNLAFINFFSNVSHLCLRILSLVSWILPLCTVSLTAAAVGAIVDVGRIFTDLGVFLGVLGLSIALHHYVILILVVLLVNRRQPWVVARHAWHPTLQVFATTSTVLVVPELFSICDKLKVPLPQAEVGIPLVLMTNTSGAGTYVCLAAVLLAYLEGVYLSLPHYLVLGILSVTSMMSIDVVSNGAIAGLLIVTSSMGLPTTKIGLLIAIEWIADRLRAPCNVMATLTCVYVANRLTSRGRSTQKHSPPVYIHISRL